MMRSSLPSIDATLFSIARSWAVCSELLFSSLLSREKIVSICPASSLCRSSQIDRAHCTPLANDEQETFFNLLVERQWVTSYVEPIWHNRRYRITPRGMTALEGM